MDVTIGAVRTSLTLLAQFPSSSTGPKGPSTFPEGHPLKTAAPEGKPPAWAASDSAQLRGKNGAQLGAAVLLHIERTVLFEVHQESPSAFPMPGAGQGNNPLQGFMDDLLEFFNPENTAQRIADFVTQGFAGTSFGEKGTDEARQNFVDFILPHIRQGVDEALGAFGELPEEISGKAEDTFSIVRDLLNGFAVKSPEEEETPEA